tara:strand:- start:2163 stop:2474 length:312 start_codon:yes stop_codon:yes gene_type:complete
MIITKQIIIQNLEYLNNTQPFKHYLAIEGLDYTISHIMDSLGNMEIPTIHVDFDDLSLYNPGDNTVEKFYNIIFRITSNIDNKNTYIPTLAGAFIVNSLESHL